MVIETTNITAKIKQFRMHIIPNCPTNCFLVLGEKHNLIIDTGFGDQTAKHILEQIDKHKDTIVINTHYHWDHIWGNKYITKISSIGHDNIIPKINNKWDEMLFRNRSFVSDKCEKENIQITFSDRLTLVDDGVYLFYSPGHSDDSISVYIEKENTLIVGDNIGDNDSEIVPYLECTHDVYQSTLDEYINFKANIVLSGHYEKSDSSVFTRIKTQLLGS